MKSLTLIGKRWFRRGPGTTYHSVEIWVDGVMVNRIPYAYGYGNQWEWNATVWLHANGYLPDIGMMASQPDTVGESIYTYCERHGIAYVGNVTDVARKKDL